MPFLADTKSVNTRRRRRIPHAVARGGRPLFVDSPEGYKIVTKT